MKIKNTMPNLMIDGGLFKEIPELVTLGVTAAQMGIRYRFHSGDKTVGGLVTEYLDDNDQLTGQNETLIGTLIHDYFAEKWGREILALGAAYNPIENYDRNEDETIEHKGADINVSDGYQDHANHNVSSYDQTSLMPESEDISTIASRKVTLNKGTSETKTSRIHGNVGVTTNQQMITAEMEMRDKYKMLDIIIKDVDEFCTLKIYE